MDAGSARYLLAYRCFSGMHSRVSCTGAGKVDPSTQCGMLWNANSANMWWCTPTPHFPVVVHLPPRLIHSLAGATLCLVCWQMWQSVREPLCEWQWWLAPPLLSECTASLAGAAQSMPLGRDAQCAVRCGTQCGSHSLSGSGGWHPPC